MSVSGKHLSVYSRKKVVYAETEKRTTQMGNMPAA
jgi:hypothetical protein